MDGKKVLIADDEPRMRKLLSDFLSKEGYAVLEAEDGRGAVEVFKTSRDINLVILDVMMPVMDGWAACRAIRDLAGVPIIMLTARGEEQDELRGFAMGADEYISKPFSPTILVARAEALLRRAAGPAVKKHSMGRLEIDEAAHHVSLDGEGMQLSLKEYELLLYLIKNEGIALSRGQMLGAVWEYDYEGDTRTVDTHIKKLRAKMGSAEDYIQTVRGVGYRLKINN